MLVGLHEVGCYGSDWYKMGACSFSYWIFGACSTCVSINQIDDEEVNMTFSGFENVFIDWKSSFIGFVIFAFDICALWLGYGYPIKRLKEGEKISTGFAVVAMGLKFLILGGGAAAAVFYFHANIVGFVLGAAVALGVFVMIGLWVNSSQTSR